MGKLTARTVQTLSDPGRYGDGDGLYLLISRGGTKSWVLRVMLNGRRRDFGLGSTKLISLAKARDLAREFRVQARDGIDPTVVRRLSIPTFSEVAREVHSNLTPSWRNKKHATVWLSSLEKHVFPSFGSRRIDQIGSADIVAVLSPIWIKKHETAKRVRQRLRSIFDWAKVNGLYREENPVLQVERALPLVKHEPQHMNAMPWRELPEFIAELRKREGVSARALEFLILTATRSGETRGARWNEIDGKCWTIPGDRMKRGKPHRIPLSSAARAILDQVRAIDPVLIFPSPSRDRKGQAKIQSDMTFKSLMSRMGVSDITTHGFRSTFRDWCSEYAEADQQVAEAALSHVVGSRVERAYARSDLFDRREALMENWANFLNGGLSNVVEINRART